MPALPLPFTIGGSKVTKDRVTGPPSKMFPLLRDLAQTDQYQIRAVIDTDKSRLYGEFHSGSGSGFWFTEVKGFLPPNEDDVGNWELGYLATSRRSLKYSDVLAVRVIAVIGELPEQPTRNRFQGDT